MQHVLDLILTFVSLAIEIFFSSIRKKQRNRKRKTRVKQIYIPTPRSASWTFLYALGKQHLKEYNIDVTFNNCSNDVIENEFEFIEKTAILRKAQEYSEKSLAEAEDANRWYDGCSCIGKTLAPKGYVDRSTRKRMSRLTLRACDVAKRIIRTEEYPDLPSFPLANPVLHGIRMPNGHDENSNKNSSNGSNSNNSNSKSSNNSNDNRKIVA